MRKEFAQGIYFNDKHQKAPEFVVGSISIQRDKLVEFLATQKTNEKGYINLDILRSKKDNKPYMVVNDYQTRKETHETTPNNAVTSKSNTNIPDDDIPTIQDGLEDIDVDINSVPF